MDRRGRVEPFAPRTKLADRADRIAARHQRPDVWRAAQALGEDLGPAVEPDRRPAAIQRPSVARIDDRPATGRDHPADVGRGIGRAEVGDGRPLERPEGGLAVLLEDLRDRPPGARFDALVDIDERRGVAIRQAPPDDALAAARAARPARRPSPASVVAAGAGLVGPGETVAGRHGGFGYPTTGDRRLGRGRDPLPIVREGAPTSSTVSPPNFSSTNDASVSSTIASPTTPAAGTTLMSLRS